MPRKKSKTKSGRATLASVKKEMAKPRVARSARITGLNLDTARTGEQPSTSVPGNVDKIIPSPGPSQPEDAQIAVDKADRPHRDFRIENTLTDEHGDDVKLKKGAHVEVTGHRLNQCRNRRTEVLLHIFTLPSELADYCLYIRRLQ
jgi:hypothetical protein